MSPLDRLEWRLGFLASYAWGTGVRCDRPRRWRVYARLLDLVRDVRGWLS